MNTVLLPMYIGDREVVYSEVHMRARNNIPAPCAYMYDGFASHPSRQYHLDMNTLAVT